jgi:cobalt-zinc-cadmium efflux system membrane fusion protein
MSASGASSVVARLVHRGGRAASLVALLGAGASAPACSGCERATATEDGARAPTIERRGEKLYVPAGSPLRHRLTLEPVQLRPVERRIMAPSTVEAEPTRLAKISPPLPGRVVSLLVRFGDSVKKGAPLFTIDSPDLVAAQSDYLKAKSAFDEADRNVARQRDLAEHGIAAQRELEHAQAERDTAKSELARATTRLQLLGGGVGSVGGPLTVTSPIAGRVIELSTAPGQYQNDPATVLMIIADLSSVWVTANIQEKDIRRVHEQDDAVASFAAYPGEAFPGKVLFVGDLLDPETRTIKVRIQLDNASGRLKPGMFATVSFQQKPVEEVLIPSSALVVSGDKSRVYVETGGWELERRTVEVADQVGDDVVVSKGLAVGTRIVTENAVLLP